MGELKEEIVPSEGYGTHPFLYWTFIARLFTAVDIDPGGGLVRLKNIAIF
ncbi:MAG: hypothetical protein WAM14_00645 [Candidatus Nitrosopolaris sp.]